MKRVFVSYSRRDKIYAERIARDLSDAGLDVWIDFRQIQGGEKWRDEIQRGLDRSEMLVLVMSPEALTRPWVQREIITVRDQKKPIFPAMIRNSFQAMEEIEEVSWLLDVQAINFEDRYEEGFQELLAALPGSKRIGPFDSVDPANIPNPFKGLEAFQQTDEQFFFGREGLVRKALNGLRPDRDTHFLAVVGASGSGKSSLVRAGVIPQIRQGAVPGSESWRLAIFSPGEDPILSLATRLAPLLVDDRDAETIAAALRRSPESLHAMTELILADAPDARLLLVVDQFEEAFTRASDEEATAFLELLRNAAVHDGGRTMLLITMRADFFDRLGQYPQFAELYEQAENLVIVTEMTTANLYRAITGPAEAVGLIYEQGLADRILEDVRRQPGSLPLLQYALKALYEMRNGRMLTNAAYDEIGGVQRAIASLAENIYQGLNSAQQDIMKRVLLRLVEVNENGEPTRRRVRRNELSFQNVADAAVQDVVNVLTAAESRLLVASREIKLGGDVNQQPVTWLEVSHEAFIREWDRFREWVAENAEDLRYGSELLKDATGWRASGGDAAYLLSGSRLNRAEEWLERADANNLQREFIRASVEDRQQREVERQAQAERELELQRRAANRLRLFVGVLAVALVVAGVLSLLAIQAQRTAEESAELALIQQQQARSLALSSSARSALNDGNEELAVALAVEANLVTDNPPANSRLTLAAVAFAPNTRLVFSGHTRPVNVLAYGPNGDWILSASTAADVLMWDAVTGELMLTMEGHAGDVTALDVSPDGTRAITGDEDGTLILWDLTTGEMIGSPITLNQATEDESEILLPQAVRTIAYSGDGKRILVGFNDGVLVKLTADGVEEVRLDGHAAGVTDVAYNPANSEEAVSISQDSTIIVWNLLDNSIEAQVVTDQAPLALAFSPDGERIAIGFNAVDDAALVATYTLDGILFSDGGSINAGLASEIQMVGHTDDVVALAFDNNGNRLVTGSSDTSVILWDAGNGQRIRRFSAHDSSVRDVAFSAGGGAVRLATASGDATVRVWDVTEADVISTFPAGTVTGEATSVAYYNDGTFLLAAHSNGVVRVWEPDQQRIVQELHGHTDDVTDVEVAPDGIAVLTASEDQTVRLWNLGNGSSTVYSAHTAAVNDLASIPGTTQFVSVGSDGRVILWDTATGQVVRVFGQPLGEETVAPIEFTSIAVSPDTTLIATGANDGIVRVWRLADGTLTASISEDDDGISAVAFSPDGTQVLSGAIDGEVILWNLDGTIVQQFIGHQERQPISAVTFGPDGLTVLTSGGGTDRTVRLWEVDSGFELRRYSVNATSFTDVDIDINGETILTGLGDGRMRLWRMYATLDSLLVWTYQNRHIAAVDCDLRVLFSLEACVNDVAPTRAPLATPVANDDDPNRLIFNTGDVAVVNTTLAAIGEDGTLQVDTLNVRSRASISASVLTKLNDGTAVTIVGGARMSDGILWREIRTPDGIEGWAAGNIPADNLQTLVPLTLFE